MADWAITAYFNPAGYRRRRSNYTVFRRYLQLPLLAVELAFADNPFELAAGDADILIQLRGGDVMWQKERLLNLALDALPADCTRIAWVDCDIVFADKNWPVSAARQLDRVALIQPMSHIALMPPDWIPGGPSLRPLRVLNPPSWLIASGMSPEFCLEEPSPVPELGPGMAWMGHRDFLERYRFYDAGIMGGGDSLMVSAAYGVLDAAMRGQFMQPRCREHYLAWARPVHAALRGSVEFIDGLVFHLWHGAWHNRGYTARHEGLIPFEFDPHSDIAIDASGAWRWSTAKPTMHCYVRDYFLSRREDD